MARTLYFIERLWFSSTFTFATFTEPAFSLAISSMSGAIILHGPHHSAQKSTRTGCSLWVTSLSKFESSRVTVAEFSMPLRYDVIPNLNQKNEGGDSEQTPTEGPRK
jgi:hypothetical protein